MDVTVCGRPGGDSADYADLAIVAPFGVVLLDGASAFEPVDVHPATYARTLGASITALLHGQADRTIADVVAEAISRTTTKLDLTAGASPSSTVAILRARDDVVDLYVLGDSPIHYGAGDRSHQLVDERLARVARPEHDQYVARLRAGHGYNDEHRRALVHLQQAQKRARNAPGGYWIAEATPEAAYHGLTATIDRSALAWAVLATDGASDFLNHAGKSWSDIAHYDRPQLNELLLHIHKWEHDVDANGRQLPRAKRHDDKTIVVVSIHNSAA